MSIENAYRLLYSGVILVLIILAGIMLIRSVIGPRITDRILSVNMLSTMVVAVIAVSSRLLGESYLTDVALIYTMISFVAVMMLAAMYIPVRRKHPDLREISKDGNQNSGGRNRRAGKKADNKTNNGRA